MIINFTDFISEAAYLKGHRQPLYHFTSSLDRIMNDDLLKLGKPVRGFNGKLNAICVTRNPDFAEHGDIFIELDYSKLYNKGYRAYPVDEWAWQKDGTANPKNSTYNFNKSQFPEVLVGRRGTKHGVKTISHKLGILETEFEERIFKEITEVGKYIISINFPIGSRISEDILKKYLEKYPHIKVYNITQKDHRKKTDRTEFKKEPVKEPKQHYVDKDGNIIDKDGKYVWKDGEYLIESVNDNVEGFLVELLDNEDYIVDLKDNTLSIRVKRVPHWQFPKEEQKSFDYDYIKEFFEPLDTFIKKEYKFVVYRFVCEGFTIAGLDKNEVLNDIKGRKVIEVGIRWFNPATIKEE